MNRVALLFPELLLLIVPLLFVYFWRGRSPGLGGLVRIVILAILAVVAAVPLAPLGGRGVDVVIVADLSRSMPADSRTRGLEVIRMLDQRASTGDRVGIVVYGREARIDRLPEEFGASADFLREVDPDGSDLGSAISLAASLIPRERPGRLIVLSDGESNGAPVEAAAYEAASRGIPIDFRLFTRSEAADIAVESLDVPGVVDEREPFQFTASVRADRTAESEAVLFRDDVEIARMKRTFQPGATELTFRDVIDRPGVARYRLQLLASGDRVPDNNVGNGAVRVDPPATILLVNASGGPDNLSRALSAGKLRVDIIAPPAFPKDLAALTAYRGVILENVPASGMGPPALEALVHFSTDLGGGLLLTGGGGSFGVGGYFKSALDPYLPVSMELKNEHRKLSLAMVVALDRSGSMAAPVGDGRTKMDLANEGTCAAIETLGPYDEIGVIAVDSSPHVISSLVSASDKDRICGEVRRIQSMGGGIFTYTALVTAAQMVQESEKGTRHVVLFADAADAEEPGDYQRLLERLTPLGITVSVIGLGSESDPDAAFLKDVAARGQGRLHFAATPDDLPRLFAQEAITVARSSFVTEATPARALPDMVLLGESPASAFPSLDGYNLTYLRPGATMGVVTTDEYKAPVLAFWHRGLGRVAALTAEADGKYSTRFNAWGDFQGFAVGLGRWLLGGEPPSGVRATIDRRGGQGIVRVELDPDRRRGAPDDVRVATATIVPPGERTGSATRRLTLSWIGEDTLEARFPLEKAGLYLGAVQLGTGTVLPLAPLSLPYSPEFEPRTDPEEGKKTLQGVARVTGGAERTTWDDVFSARLLRNRQVKDLVIPLTLMVLLLQMTEIAGRRLLWFQTVGGWLNNLKMPTLRRRPRPQPAPVDNAHGRPEHRRGATAPVSSETAPAPGPGAPEPAPDLIRRPVRSVSENGSAKREGGPLERAKKKARNRMGR